jgi:acetyl esterase/lipase/lysophospholipase L1-like esterase
MRPAKILLPLLVCVLTVRASEPMPLWPGVAPGEKGDSGPERSISSDYLVGGRAFTEITNLPVPTIQLFRAPSDKDTGAAVIVCPGGGYRILSIDLEGTEVCDWLNSIGVNAVLLKYRVPSREGREFYAAALEDGQRAVSLVRSHAAEWRIDPNRIGMLGFSAGAHLSAACSTRFDQRSYAPVDAADQFSCRPDFAVLMYAGRLIRKDATEIAPELTVTSNTPPTLLIATEDDPVARVDSSLFYYLALKRAGVPAEMHLYASGGHGYGLRSDKPVKVWPTRTEEWLRGLGVLQNINSAAPTNHLNTAIIPVAQTNDWALDRQALVLRRAKENPGTCDIIFIGDSNTQFWEKRGTNVANKYFAGRKCLNFGVLGDRTENVLWRFEQGQLAGLQPKVAVVMIGSNNTWNTNQTTADVLAGIQAVVKQVRTRLPQTKVILMGIMPHGATFNKERGEALQINEALARMDDGRNIFFFDWGSKLIADDGTVSKSIQHDYVHLTDAGYQIWAETIEPKLKELLAAPGR